MTALGIDVGTTSVSLVRTDEEGRFLDARTYPGEPQGADRTQDADALVRRVERAVRDFGGADLIAVTGQMHGILYMDTRGQAVSPLYTWQNPFGDRLRTEDETYARYASRVTGYPVSSGYGLVTHLYLTEHGEAPGNAAKLGTIGDYVVMKLAGTESPVMHVSNAASLGFFDLLARHFDERALEELGMDADILPTVVTGFGSVAPGIYTAVGDNQASFAGAAGTDADTILANVGTGGQLSCLVHGYETCAHCETRPYDGDDYLLVAASLCGGRAYAVLERFFAQTLAAYGICLAQDEIYAGMARMQESTPALTVPALTVDTAFAGTREEPGRRGEIRGISEANFTPGALADGVLRGIAAEFLPAYRAMCARHDFRRMALAGNAVRKNPALRAAFRELYGLPFIPDAPPEEAALGAAKMAVRRYKNRESEEAIKI